jgi:integrase
MPSQSVKLTKRVVDEASPKAKRYEIWDGETRGLGLRVEASGTKTYILRYRPRNLGPGAPRRFLLLGRHGAITPDEARTRARATLGAVAAGQDPALERKDAAAAVTCCELANLFLDEHVGSKRKAYTAKGYGAILRRYFVPALGKRKAEFVTMAEIAKLHLSLRDRPYQANRLLAIIGSMYSFAARRGLVSRGTNPTIGLERFREAKRERFLGTEELKRLSETLRLAETEGLPWLPGADARASKHLVKEPNQRTVFAPEVALAFRLLLFTGARLREILHLEWAHVDLERGLLLLPDSKTGRKTIVLNAPALALLRDVDRSSAFVVPGTTPDQPRSDLKRPWRAIQRHAGLSGVRIHDLRHTFASVGAGSSLGLPIVGKLLGHSQSATTARYAHLDADPLRRAANIIGEKISGAMGS